jgi:threonine dehydrogenase-like Zn-dependent dehydrogenase
MNTKEIKATVKHQFAKNGNEKMKAVAVYPGVKDSVHLRDDVPRPRLSDIPNGRGVMVKILHIGVDGTDKEIVNCEYGAAPEGSDYLICGHETLGLVVETSENVKEFSKGDYVVTTVRRPGMSIYDKIGNYDMTTDEKYYEHGINLLHGFLTEYYVEDPEYLIKVPVGLRNVAVLTEPISIVEKGIEQAFELQKRLKVWRPRKAAVLGAGPIGLLATLVLRLKGIETTTIARTPAPYRNSDLVEEMGAKYFNTQDKTLTEIAASDGPYDLIFEATGYSPFVFEGMNVLGKNGVLVLSSVTGGGRNVSIPSDKINLGFVLGNKVVVGTVNASREYFEMGIKDFALAKMMWPGLLEKFLTHKINGLENYRDMYKILFESTDLIKVYMEVANEN